MVFLNIFCFFNWTPLHLATANNDFEVVSFLLKQKDIDINSVNDWNIFFSLIF